MTSRRTAPRRRSSSRRAVGRYEWFDAKFSQTTAANALAQTTLDSNLSSGFKKGATVMRCIVNLLLTPSAIDLMALFHFGICLLTIEAVASATLPDPEDMDDQPGWLWRTMYPATTHDLNVSPPSATKELDLRSRRRYIGEDYSLVFVTSMGGAVGGQVDGYIRTLIRHA